MGVPEGGWNKFNINHREHRGIQRMVKTLCALCVLCGFNITQIIYFNNHGNTPCTTTEYNFQNPTSSASPPPHSYQCSGGQASYPEWAPDFPFQTQATRIHKAGCHTAALTGCGGRVKCRCRGGGRVK